MIPNESSLTSSQILFLRALLEGKREMNEREALTRAKKLELSFLRVPCVVVCVSPYYLQVDYDEKDELIASCSRFVCNFFLKKDYSFYCLTNTYENMQIILPTESNQIAVEVIDPVLIQLHQEFYQHFHLDLFIGVGSEVSSFSQIYRSASEAMEMLAYKHQYGNSGVVNIINTTKFKYYSTYGEDIMFARVLGRFQDGNIRLMANRLEELIESIRHRPYVSKTAIKRTIIELAVNVLHIASNSNVDVDAILDNKDFYSWVMKQNHTEILTDWLLKLSSKLMEAMAQTQKNQEKKIITDACNIIAAHLGDADLSLQMVSQEVGLSSSYFSQLFKSEKGIGFASYVTERRIEKAKDLLTNTNLKGEEIAALLGFTSASYFGRVFKEATGETPSAYRLGENKKK